MEARNFRPDVPSFRIDFPGFRIEAAAFKFQLIMVSAHHNFRQLKVRRCSSPRREGVVGTAPPRRPMSSQVWSTPLQGNLAHKKYLPP